MIGTESSTSVNDPTGPEDGDQFSELKREVLDAHRGRAPWREETRRAYRFVANHPWEQDDLTLLKDENRPAISFNRVAPIIKAVCGLQINNRQDVIFLERKLAADSGSNEESLGDDVAEATTAAVKWVRDECDAQDEESEMFRDTAICGEGWCETRMSYDDDPKGKVVQERLPPLEMGVNRGARRSNYRDARLMYRVRELSVKDAKALFAEPYTTGDMHAGWMEDMIQPADGGEGNKRDYPSQTREALMDSNGARDKVRIVQVQWWDYEPLYMVAQQGDQKIQHMDESQFTAYSERVSAMQQADPMGAPSFNHVRTRTKVYYQAFLGSKMLGAPEKLPMKDFNFGAMTGDYDEEKKMYYGMMRDLFDPQMWANKWLSQSMHIMNSNAKGGLMAEKGVFENDRKAELDWTNPRKIIFMKPGAISGNKIKQREPPAVPSGLDNLLQFALSSIRDVTGVNLELLGQADREQAASLEAQRRQSAMTILATIFNNLRRFHKVQGRKLLHFVQMLPEDTLVRTLAQGQVRYIPLIKSKDYEKFDCIIDETPSSPDQKQMVWGLTEKLLSQGLPLPMNFILTLLKYSPYPQSVVAELMKAMGMGGQENPEQTKTKLQQAEQALHVMEQALQQAQEAASTAEDKASIEMMKVEIEEYRAETERMKVEGDTLHKIATGAADSAHKAMDREHNVSSKALDTVVAHVTAENQPQLPAEGGASAQASGPDKLDQIMQMLQQLMSGEQNEQQTEQPEQAAPAQLS